MARTVQETPADRPELGPAGLSGKKSAESCRHVQQIDSMRRREAVSNILRGTRLQRQAQQGIQDWWRVGSVQAIAPDASAFHIKIFTGLALNFIDIPAIQ